MFTYPFNHPAISTSCPSPYVFNIDHIARTNRETYADIMFIVPRRCVGTRVYVSNKTVLSRTRLR